MKKSNNAINIVSKIIYSIFLCLTIFMFIYLFNIKLLPIRYLIVFLSVYSVIFTILSIFLLNKKIKSIFKVTSAIVTVLLSLIMMFGVTSINKIVDFMKGLNKLENQIIEYVLIVNKDSDISNIEQLNNKKISVFIHDLELYKMSKIELEKKIEYIEIEEYDLSELKSKLIDNEIDAIYLESSFYSMLLENDEEFQSKIFILTSFFFEIKSETETIKKLDIVNNSFILYLSGSDSTGLSDVNILMVVNPKTNEILTLSIPRDYYVESSKSKKLDKLTHSALYGIDTSVKTIENLLDINIDFSIKVNFSSLINLIDIIEGIDVYSEYSFESFDGHKFVKGMNHMDGEKALSFSRERVKLPGGDIARGKNQQEIIKAIINKVTKSKTILVKYQSILKSLENSFYTNLDADNIMFFARNQLITMNSWEINTHSLNGTNAERETPWYGTKKLWVIIPDPNSIEEAKEMINSILLQK